MGKVVIFLIIAAIIFRIIAISVHVFKYVSVGFWVAALLLILVAIFKKMFFD